MAVDMVQKTLECFEKVYGDSKGAKVYFAPGRVNLIGEHTDYNGGHVFPCALSIGTYAAVRPRKDGKLFLYSGNIPDKGVTESRLGDFRPLKEDSWTGYPKGVMWAFDKQGMKMERGLDIAFYGNIPNGSGLSSSASLEVLTGYFLRDLYGFDVSNVELALIGQDCENNYNGMNCGIMDQFASAMGKAGNAIFLDTATLEYKYAPLDLRGLEIIITNTNKKHKLVGSAYNDRRRESEEALKQLKAVPALSGIKALGELSNEDFDKYAEAISDPVVRKRARHAVYENNRTIEAVAVLERGEIARFGELMNQSHVSLRDDYEVSCPELDVLAEEAWKIPGCLGARMTGGGFGGCTVSIVKEEAAEEFQKKVGDAYREKIGYDCSFYTPGIGGGPREEA